MPIDTKAPDVIKLGKDLLNGDIIRSERGSHGTYVILRINGLKEFYSGESHFEFYDLNDCQCGTFSGHLDLNKKYSVVQSRDEIISAYNTVELDLLRHAADIMNSRNSLIGVRKEAFDRLNNKLAKKKKKCWLC